MAEPTAAAPAPVVEAPVIETAATDATAEATPGAKAKPETLQDQWDRIARENPEGDGTGPAKAEGDESEKPPEKKPKPKVKEAPEDPTPAGELEALRQT